MRRNFIFVIFSLFSLSQGQGLADFINTPSDLADESGGFPMMKRNDLASYLWNRANRNFVVILVRLYDSYNMSHIFCTMVHGP